MKRLSKEACCKCYFYFLFKCFHGSIEVVKFMITGSGWICLFDFLLMSQNSSLFVPRCESR